MTALLTQLQLLLSALPFWAWWILVNLTVGTWVALAQIPELDARKRSVAVSVRLALLFGLMCVGVLVAVAIWLVEHIEAKTFRQATEGKLT